MAHKHSSQELFTQAQQVIPGGVNSPVRAFRRVGGTPFFVAEAAGAYLTDVDGRRYVDFVGAYGPLLLGHGHPRVSAAVHRAVERGLSYGAPHPGEVELATRLTARFPAVDMLRLVSSGTEATMTALRLARAATGREKVLKFDGCYHGHFDGFLVRAGSGAATHGVPDSAGVPPSIAAQTETLPFNNRDAVAQLLAERGHEFAAVIVEPIAGNMGLVPPLVGFLEGLRETTSEHGVLLIFDEVITGLRVGPSGAQGLYGIPPDLTTLGKIIGGGMPIGAVGGRRELMEQLAPLGAVYQAGTLAGNPLSVAAGLAVLDELDARPQLYEELDRRGQRFATSINRAAASAGVPYTATRFGSMLSLVHKLPRLINYDDAVQSARGPFARLFHLLLEHGVFLPPSPFETFFLSAAHDDGVLELAEQAFSNAFSQLAAESRPEAGS